MRNVTFFDSTDKEVEVSDHAESPMDGVGMATTHDVEDPQKPEMQSKLNHLGNIDHLPLNIDVKSSSLQSSRVILKP